jgi:hypothetical protein
LRQAQCEFAALPIAKHAHRAMRSDWKTFLQSARQALHLYFLRAHDHNSFTDNVIAFEAS